MELLLKMECLNIGSKEFCLDSATFAFDPLFINIHRVVIKHISIKTDKTFYIVIYVLVLL